MTSSNNTTSDELDDPYVREVSVEQFIDDVEKASEEQELDEEE